jgi:hypothetical protein
MISIAQINRLSEAFIGRISTGRGHGEAGEDGHSGGARSRDAAGQSKGAHSPRAGRRGALSRIDDFAAFVTADPRHETKWAKLFEAELVGRPVGAKAWVEGLEEQFNRNFSPQKRGPKPRTGRGVETGGLFDI